MIISRIELSNFGRHKELSFDCAVPIVGILGANGAGKSTVLDSIELALTGITRDPMDSYVRNGEGNASVTLDFVKNGKAGRVTRQIGKTSKRLLEWDGREIRAAKEVDKTMAEIFGADKSAISNAVFINQGKVHEILFCNDADRKRLFVDLVGFSFSEQRAKILDGKIKKISCTIVDLTPARDAANEQRLAAAEYLETKQKELTAAFDYMSELAEITARIVAQTKIEEILLQRSRLENEKAISGHQLERLLKEANVESVGDVQAKKEELEQAVGVREEVLNQAKAVAADLAHYERITREICELTIRAVKVQQDLTTLNPESLTVEQIRSELTGITARKKALNDVKAAQASMERSVTQLRAHTEDLKQWQNYADSLNSQEHQSKAWLEQLRKETHQLDGLLATLRSSLKIREEMAKCFKHEDCKSSCPKCGLEIVDPSLLSPEGIGELRAQIEYQTATLARNNTQLAELGKAWSDADTQIGALQRQISAAEANIAQLQKTLDAHPGELEQEDQLLNREKMLSNIVSQKNLLEAQRAQISRDMKAKMEAKAKLKLAEPNLANRAEFTPQRLGELQDSLKEYQEAFRQWNNFLRDLEAQEAVLANNTRQLAILLDDQSKYEELLKSPVSEVLAKVVEESAGDWRLAQTELSARQQVRQELQGMVKSAHVAYEEANTRYFDLIARMEADAEKQKLIQDLIRIKEALSIDGLPMAMVNHHFGKLAELTQEALAELNANFQIQIDPERELSFTFRRLDEENAIDLPMVKLSGGQRVRLCVAFLLAVQRRLVSEVGLLVIDEISSHTDQEGVENMAEMLRNLNVELKNTEMQIWIVDHNQTLEPALGKVVNL